jgi:hypothetical protein
MNKDQITAIVIHLMENVKSLKYGITSAVLRVHEGRLVKITYETNVCVKENEEVQNEIIR